MSHSAALSLLCAAVGLCLVGGCSVGLNQKHSALDAGSELRLAEAADNNGNADLALSMYQAAASRAPSDISAQLHYADALARGGRILEAQRFLTQQISAHPGQRDVARSSALVDIIAGDPAAAIPKLDRLIAADPRDQNARTDKGVALDMLGKHAEAQQQYYQVLVAQPGDIAVKNDLAMSMMLEGRQRDAQALLKPVGEAYDAPARVRVNLAVLYAANGDVARAQEIAKGQLDQSELMALARGVNQASSNTRSSR